MCAALLFLVSLPVAGQDNDLIAELVREDISNVARDKIVEQLKRSDVSATAPKILGVIREYSSPSEPGFGNKPWMDSHLSHRARVWYAAAAVWTALWEGKNDPAKVSVLLKLLQDTQLDEASRRKVLDTLRVYQWSPGAEKTVLRMLQDPTTSYSSQLGAINVLLKRCGEVYIPQAIEFVGKTRTCVCFQHVLGIGNKFFDLRPENQEKIVKLGFEILEANAKTTKMDGYFVAGMLATYLKIPPSFLPDPVAAKYQGPNGLNERYFSDTVENVLEWRRQHAMAPKRK